ncbi:hypothetical protein [Francisella frigiditurris]|uniref:Uncharacterized protein n=1 Tax=Francisella frigiditurris TaxID=1542390 RepID=A0A1J0KW11_9GAMM|nr:hypothetical protein [Francisella frigiditurris]APC98008.1 hypothetical protein KX01_1866 [Francisella frigiditurris]
MFFICKLESHRIEGDNGLILHVKNAKKDDDVSQYKNKQRIYSLLNCGEDMESYRTIKVFASEELANEELETMKKEDPKHWQGWEVMEYGQELKDTVSTFMNTFKFQMYISKAYDSNHQPTGDYMMMHPLGFHEMIIQYEEVKKELERIATEQEEKLKEQEQEPKKETKSNLLNKIKNIFNKGA